jgi:hypothetical protein
MRRSIAISHPLHFVLLTLSVMISKVLMSHFSIVPSLVTCSIFAVCSYAVRGLFYGQFCMAVFSVYLLEVSLDISLEKILTKVEILHIICTTQYSSDICLVHRCLNLLIIITFHSGFLKLRYLYCEKRLRDKSST